MQNSLAILSFPLAATECATPCVGPSDQGFASSFGDVSIAAEEETAPTSTAASQLALLSAPSKAARHSGPRNAGASSPHNGGNTQAHPKVERARGGAGSGRNHGSSLVG